MHHAAVEFSNLNVRTKSFFLDNHLAILDSGGLRYETIPITGRGHLVADVPELDRLACRQVHRRHPTLPRTHEHAVRARSIARDVAGALRLHLLRRATDPAATRHLDGLLERPEQSVAVVGSSSVNACVVGDGRMVLLNAGLLERFAGNDAAVAFAVGHEFGHAVARHQAEASAGHVLCLLLARISAWGGEELAGTVAGIAGALLTASRAEAELEADYIGALLAASAGYDPRLAAPRVFLELAADCGFGDEVLLSRLRIAVGRVMGEALGLYCEALAVDLERLASRKDRLEEMITTMRGLC